MKRPDVKETVMSNVATCGAIFVGSQGFARLVLCIAEEGPDRQHVMMIPGMMLLSTDDSKPSECSVFTFTLETVCALLQALTKTFVSSSLHASTSSKHEQSYACNASNLCQVLQCFTSAHCHHRILSLSSHVNGQVSAETPVVLRINNTAYAGE